MSAEDRKVAQPLLDAFGEVNIAKLFSKTWQLREEAINEIEDEVMNHQKLSNDQAFVASMGVVRHTIGDRMAGVS